MARYQRDDSKTGASLLFSLDFDHHKSGWLKNPDYDRCFHLSLASLGAVLSGQTTRDISGIPDLTRATREAWCKAFFREYCRLLWVEPPFTELGKRAETYHYRLFVDVSGAPLLPRGEVYSRELTASGWQSWSDVHSNDESETP